MKNIPHVISGFARIADKIPAILAMVGEGPEREAAEEQVRELGLRDQVHFLGREERVQHLFRRQI